MKIIVEVVRSIPQEVEDIVEVFVPLIHEPIVEAVIPDERLSQRDETLFLQTGEIGEVIQTFRQERHPTVDALVPHVFRAHQEADPGRDSATDSGQSWR